MHDLLFSFSALGSLLTPRLICLLAAAVFAAAILRGFTGFGFALAAVPLLGLFMSPTQAVPVAIGLQLLGSLIDFRQATKSCHWPSLRWMTIGAVVGSPIGALVLSHVPAPVARMVIGSITMLAVLALGRGFALAGMPAWLPTVTGFFAGVFNGLAAMPGPPAVAYYMSAPLPRAAVRSSLMVFFLLTSVAAMASGIALGLITLQTFSLSLLGLPVMWIGTKIGHMAFIRGSDQMRRRVSIGSLGVIALVSAIKGLSELG